MLIRAAEHCTKSPRPGLLSSIGASRARELPGLFGARGVDGRGALPMPEFIFVCGSAEALTSVERETVSPLARASNISIDEDYGLGEEHRLVGNVEAIGATVLICWPLSAIPLIARLVLRNEAFSVGWPEGRFDLIWSFVWDSDRGAYRFGERIQRISSDSGADPGTG